MIYFFLHTVLAFVSVAARHGHVHPTTGLSGFKLQSQEIKTWNNVYIQISAVISWHQLERSWFKLKGLLIVKSATCLLLQTFWRTGFWRMQQLHLIISLTKAIIKLQTAEGRYRHCTCVVNVTVDTVAGRHQHFLSQHKRSLTILLNCINCVALPLTQSTKTHWLTDPLSVTVRLTISILPASVCPSTQYILSLCAFMRRAYSAQRAGSPCSGAYWGVLCPSHPPCTDHLI